MYVHEARGVDLADFVGGYNRRSSRELAALDGGVARHRPRPRSSSLRDARAVASRGTVEAQLSGIVRGDEQLCDWLASGGLASARALIAWGAELTGSSRARDLRGAPRRPRRSI